MTSDARAIYETDIETSYGTARVVALVRDEAERRCFGGPPVAYRARATSSHGEFKDAAGNPYGGTVTATLDGVLLAKTLYRAGCFGRPAGEVAVEIAEQVGLEMAAAKPDVYAALRAYIVAQVGDAVTHWGAEVERLRLELATAERHLADATRDLLGLDAAAKPCEDAAHASPDTDPKP